MNEIINLAIIFDFSNFDDSENYRKNISELLSQFLLFLQTFKTVYSYETRKIYISFQFSPFTHKGLYQQQYFREFDEEIWSQLTRMVKEKKYLNQYPQDLESNEKRLLSILQRFGSDFYWENNDLCSPFQKDATNLNSSKFLSAIRKNVALYVTDSFYPVIIESRNIFKTIINKLHSASVVFCWLSILPSHKYALTKIIECISLFNGYLIPYDKNRHALFYMFKYMCNLTPVLLLQKNKIYEKRNKYFTIFSETYFSDILIKITNKFLSSNLTLCGFSRPSHELLLSKKENYVNIEAKENILFWCSISNLRNLNPFKDKISQYFNEINDDCFVTQCLDSLNLFTIFSFPFLSMLEYIPKSECSTAKINLFEPWFSFSSHLNSYDMILESNSSFEIESEIIEYIENCFNGNHLTYSDSKNPESLKVLFKLSDMSQITHEFTDIKKDLNDFDIICKESMRFALNEKDGFQLIIDQYFVNIDKLIIVPNTSSMISHGNLCKSQILFRVFLLHKFPIFSENFDFICEIITLLRKLSIWRLPEWVGNFLKNELFQSCDEQFIKKFRVIYDELCHPYPRFLQSPPCENSTQKLSIDKENFENESSLYFSKNCSIRNCSSFTEGTSKRREVLVNLKQKINPQNLRKNKLNNVKRSLFGKTNSLSFHRSSLGANSTSTIFSISPDFSASFDGNENSNPSKFYLPTAQSCFSFPTDLQRKTSYEDSNCSHANGFSGSSECSKSPSIWKTCKLSPMIKQTDEINTTKKFTLSNVSIWNTTPFKYYQNLDSGSIQSQNSPKKYPLTSKIKHFSSPSPKRKRESPRTGSIPIVD